MRKVQLIALLAIVAFTSTVHAQVLLQDNFNDNKLDTTKWRIVTKGIPGNPAVYERNSRVELVSRGYLVSQSQFAPNVLGGIRVSGTWTVATAPCHDYFNVLTRCDGIPTGRYGDVQNGLGFHANTETNSLFIQPFGSLLKIGTTIRDGKLFFARGGTYHFDIFDGGGFVVFSIRDANGPARMTLSVDVVTDQTKIKHVVFYNRERVCGTNIAY